MPEMSYEGCPHCAADLRGTEIPRESLDKGYYGPWKPEDGPRYYSRKIGVEISGVYDGVLFWECPECGRRWHRWPEGSYQRAKAEIHIKSIA